MTMTRHLPTVQPHWMTNGIEPVDPTTGRNVYDLPEDVDLEGDELLEGAIRGLRDAVTYYDEGRSAKALLSLQWAAGCALQIHWQTYTGGRLPEATKQTTDVLRDLPGLTAQMITRIEAAEAALQRSRRRR